MQSWDTTSISLTAGCDLFMRYVTRTSALDREDFSSAKSRLLERAEKFGEISYKVFIWWMVLCFPSFSLSNSMIFTNVFHVRLGD